IRSHLPAVAGETKRPKPANSRWCPIHSNKHFGSEYPRGRDGIPAGCRSACGSHNNAHYARLDPQELTPYRAIGCAHAVALDANTFDTFPAHSATPAGMGRAV